MDLVSGPMARPCLPIELNQDAIARYEI
ncbi:hypothetical protein SBA3_3040010 [Candidatus Sulfopaludibacter sp. SbA3]|nr:hypothetical protein SBA3_3040010 [Candidatus Sulfopaludibacter sp. SbA3]